MPGEIVIEHMKEAAELCVKEENLDPDRVEISVTFVSTEEIQELNRIYRDKDQVTDVLSFPQYDDLNEIRGEEVICLGDVVICPEQALLQADEFGHSGERELVYLFVHSVFHLLGYDHMEEDDKTEMREQEEKIMGQVGLIR
ncbi:rRNA maturation RNase YbeY [Clostridiales bacterium BAD-6]|uniref:Endoribonuclease YbeY n=2 Tax=Sinanaerobacter chloroacetimidivorans TaxID=2818044 RepID=A0A8J8B001_9FIRM|nr:rRNA maturation RNase YbeY [Sinanaerobacter chloroacetimidivorans]